ncbi:MAG: SxtJ family membrane protein [Aestuariivirga sp.]
MTSTSTNDDVSPPSEHKFGLTFAAVFVLLALVPPLLGGHFRWWVLAISIMFFALAHLAPRYLKVPNFLWFRFGLLLHKIINPLVLGTLFLIVVTPMAVIMRLAGKKLLNRTYDPAVKSYWIERSPPGPAPETIRNQF